jgi:hypothetical protein
MLEKFVGHLNHSYLQMLRKVGKWGLILFGVTVLGLGVGVKVVLPQLMKGKVNNTNSVLYRDDQGNTLVLYKDSSLPKNYSEELDAIGPELIYENQNRSMEQAQKANEDSQSEDSPLQTTPGKTLHGADRTEIPALANNFLKAWESFDSATTPEEYKSALWPMMSSAAHDNPDAILKRKDNYQADTIGPGKSVGSVMVFDGFVPKDTMIVQRYDGNTAYVTVMGEVVLGGQSLVLRNKRYIRSYALVLTKDFGGWKVSRVVGQTLKEVLD